MQAASAPDLPPRQASLLAELRRLAWGAADILRAYARGEQPPYGFPPAMSVDHGGEGPVSAADLAVNRWLLDGLAGAFPDAGWTLLSEETAAEVLVPGQPLDADWLWILDPLDGTKDFLQGTGEYAVHLALVHGQRPVLGVVLLRRLRDEAHRFAVTYHRQQRGERMKRSRLSDIAGLGPKRVKDLLAHFRSIDAIQLASPEQEAAGPADDLALEQLVDQLPAPLVTKSNVDDKALWGNTVK